jgi:hypothetical protein
MVRAGGWAAVAPAQVPVAGVLQRAAERSCGGVVAQPEPPGLQEHPLAAGLFLENPLPVPHQARRLSLPFGPWQFASREQFLRLRLRDSRLCHDKTPT